MAKQTKGTYWEQGKADHAAVKLGNHHALARQAWANGSQSWQANAYRAGMQEAQYIENGYFEPERVWERTTHVERLALLDRAKLNARLAGKSYCTMGKFAQERIARVINGEPQREELAAPAATSQDERIAAAIGNAWTVLSPIHPTVAAVFEIRRGLDARIRWVHRQTGTISDVAFDSLYVAERAALAWLRSQPVRPVNDDRERMIAANRIRAEQLRRKYGFISTMESIPLTCKLQGPRHAPGIHWPNGEVIARSQFRQVERHDAHGKLGYVWQWAALDADGHLLQVMEFADLWELREEAAFQIADGTRFARSQWGH